MYQPALLIRVYLFCILFLMLVFSNRAYCHGAEPVQPVGTQIEAAMAVTWRDQGAVLNSNGSWQIPGVMMGGEAYPAEEGVSLDDAYLDLNHVGRSGLYGRIQLASHDNGQEVELHHAYAGYRTDALSLSLQAEAGRMAAIFTPANPEHASQRVFSETPLALQAFWGGQLNDEGLRAMASQYGVQLGVESWRGSAFPATSGAEGGAYDLFLHYRWQSDRLKWHGGIWGYRAQALNRSDQRYSAGHSHGGGMQVTAPEVWFDGDTEAVGVFLRGRWQATEQMALALEAEWMQVKPQGEVKDLTRIAGLSGDYTGGWLQGLVSLGRHDLGVRYEQLILDNRLSGAAAAELATQAGLYNDHHEPERSSLVYRWRATDGFSLRLEWVDDNTMPESTEWVALGLVWKETLYHAP